MPHLIYSGKADFAEVQRAFTPQRWDSNGWICKLLRAFLSEDASGMLFEALSVSHGYSQDYYVRIERKVPTQFTIRIDSRTNVEKNEGVKRTLLMVRDLLLAHNPELKLEKTNLPPELLAESVSPA